MIIGLLNQAIVERGFKMQSKMARTSPLSLGAFILFLLFAPLQSVQ
jgi:hypothetical protein